MEELTRVVRDLVLHHGARHEDINKCVRDVIVELSREFPKVRVLYNAAYGGYGLSDAFLNFLADRGLENVTGYGSNEERVMAVNHIADFGKAMLSRHRIVRRMLMAAVYYGIETMARCAIASQVWQSEGRTLENSKARLEEHMRSPWMHGSKTLDGDDGMGLYTMMSCMTSCITGYTQDTYASVLAKVVASIDQTAERLKCTNETYRNDHPDLLWDELYGDLEAIAHTIKKDSESASPICFLKAIEKYGERDHHIWCSNTQTYFDEVAMRYVRIKHNDHEYDEQRAAAAEDEHPHAFYDFLVTKTAIDLPADVYDKLVEIVGLMCASDQYCCLKIALVPYYANWYIHEYDGRENVRMRS